MRLRRHPAFIALLLAAALALTWLRPLDALAERQVEAGLKRALIAFATARTLNAVLSALQEASVSFQIGAGVSVKPGAVLEPLDDVVEQFSDLMFVATASFAVQRLMIEVLAAWPLCVALSLLLAAWATLAWRGRGPPPWLPRLAVALLILRLAVPVLALVGEATHQLVLARPYQQHAERLRALEEPARPPQAAGAGSAGSSGSAGSAGSSGSVEGAGGTGAGWLDRLRGLASQGGDIARQVDSLRARAQEIVENLVRLGAVFLVQTVVLPLLYVAGLLALYRAVLGPRHRPATAAAGAAPPRIPGSAQGEGEA